MPRHPPCALKNLATKMLASTMQISNNKQQPRPHHHPTPKPPTRRKPRGKTLSHPRSRRPSRYGGRRDPARGQTEPRPAQPCGTATRTQPTSHLQGGRPSSLARFLRTQQCVRTHPTPAEVAFPLPHPPHPEKGEKKDAGGTSDPAEPDHPISQCSTNERAVCRTSACNHDMNQTLPHTRCDQGQASCSLERR